MRETLICLLVLAGCARSDQGVPPPDAAFYYPTSVTVLPPNDAAPERRYALVVNSNFDLRYNAGWLSLVDLEAAVPSADGAAPDRFAAVIDQLAVPDLGGPLAVDTSRAWGAGETLVAVVAHRGEALLTLVEITMQDGRPVMSCGDPSATSGLQTFERRTDCDRRHLVRLDDPALLDAWPVEVLDDEVVDPFAVALFPGPTVGEPETLAVSFLTWAGRGGKLMLFHVDPLATPMLTPRLDSAGVPELIELPAGGVGDVDVRPPAAGCPDVARRECDTYLALSTQLYGDSSQRSSIFSVDLPVDRSRPVRLYVHGLTADAGGNEIASFIWSPDGGRAFVSNRGPDSVLGLDGSLIGTERDPDAPGPAGLHDELRPAFALAAAVPESGGPAGLAYVPRPSGDLLAVATYDDDALDFFAAPGGALVPAARLDGVGDGPWALAAVGDLVLATTFEDHALAVVTFDPASGYPILLSRLADPALAALTSRN